MIGWVPDVPLQIAKLIFTVARVVNLKLVFMD